MIDRKKQHRTLHSLIQRESWELESIKQSHRDAYTSLDKAHAELEEASRVIYELSATLRASITDVETLSLETMQMSKQYLMDKHAEQLIKRQVRQRAQQAADKAAAELEHKLLAKKGLEKVLGRKQEALLKDREKKTVFGIEENWLQRSKMHHD